MFQAEIHLQQHKECVLSGLVDEFDQELDIGIEELHDELVTFVIESNASSDDISAFIEGANQVKHVEDLGNGNVLVTKVSCGAYSAIDRNHGILQRQTSIGPNRRVYSVLFFRRKDLRAMIEDFREIGTVTLGKLAAYDGSGVCLTERQYEVIECALEAGYFEWPREISSDELADEMGVTRATLLEHLRKAESKLLVDALETATTGVDRSTTPEPASPPK